MQFDRSAAAFLELLATAARTKIVPANLSISFWSA
jgi:hypothetical protein